MVEVLPVPEPSSARAGIEALFASHADELVGMLWVFVGDRTVAEDLAQEAFVRVYRSWGRLADPSRALAYLRATAFNLARSEFRRARVAGRYAPRLARSEVSTESPDASVVLRDDQWRVVDALRGLPGRQRACLTLRFYAEMGDADIAAALDISVNSVKTHTRRGLAAVARSLKEAR